MGITDFLSLGPGAPLVCFLRHGKQTNGFRGCERECCLKLLHDLLNHRSMFLQQISRVIDYRHHPSDIVAGGLLGVVCSSLYFLLVTHLMGLQEGETTAKSEELN